MNVKAITQPVHHVSAAPAAAPRSPYPLAQAAGAKRLEDTWYSSERNLMQTAKRDLLELPANALTTQLEVARGARASAETGRRICRMATTAGVGLGAMGLLVSLFPAKVTGTLLGTSGLAGHIYFTSQVLRSDREIDRLEAEKSALRAAVADIGASVEADAPELLYPVPETQSLRACLQRLVDTHYALGQAQGAEPPRAPRAAAARQTPSRGWLSPLASLLSKPRSQAPGRSAATVASSAGAAVGLAGATAHQVRQALSHDHVQRKQAALKPLQAEVAATRNEIRSIKLGVFNLEAQAATAGACLGLAVGLYSLGLAPLLACLAVGTASLFLIIGRSPAYRDRRDALAAAQATLAQQQQALKLMGHFQDALRPRRLDQAEGPGHTHAELLDSLGDVLQAAERAGVPRPDAEGDVFFDCKAA